MLLDGDDEGLVAVWWVSRSECWALRSLVEKSPLLALGPGSTGAGTTAVLQAPRNIKNLSPGERPLLSHVPTRLRGEENITNRTKAEREKRLHVALYRWLVAGAECLSTRLNWEAKDTGHPACSTGECLGGPLQTTSPVPPLIYGRQLH